MTKRAFILVMDSFGVGASSDAAKFGDTGADTLGHIAEACAAGKADKPGVRTGPLRLPNLTQLGLGLLAKGSTGKVPAGLDLSGAPQGAYGHAEEVSHGKDTPSGHWEMAGVPVTFDWGYFPTTVPTFPAALTEALIKEAQLPGVLGNRHASGTQILEELGDEHRRTGKPIIYTSADSVFQIAAHEETFGLQRLYDLCKIARRLVDDYNVGRVIARPFLGKDAKTFKRTGNRKDYAVLPPAPTLLNQIEAGGGSVVSVGKIGDIFAHSGTGREVKADGNAALMDATLREMKTAGDRTLVFTNFVDFDTLFGHRRDVAGYAAALEAFDARLPEFRVQMQAGDLAIISADHGCDPTFPGSDHTREHIPVIAFGPDVKPQDIGRRQGFADIGQTVARHLGLPNLKHGISFL